MLFSVPMFWKMVPCGKMLTSVLSPTPSSPIGVFLFSLTFFQPDASQKIGFAVGVIGGQALVVAVFVS